MLACPATPCQPLPPIAIDAAGSMARNGRMTADSDDPFPIDPAALARAETALADLTERYLGWAEADLVRLDSVLARLAAGAGDRAGAMRELFRIAHDMKGQGGTFDYPLVSELAGRLCRLAEVLADPDPGQMAALAGLAAALGRVIRERLSGDGGAVGRALLDATYRP